MSGLAVKSIETLGLSSSNSSTLFSTQSEPNPPSNIIIDNSIFSSVESLSLFTLPSSEPQATRNNKSTATRSFILDIINYLHLKNYIISVDQTNLSSVFLVTNLLKL